MKAKYKVGDKIWKPYKVSSLFDEGFWKVRKTGKKIVGVWIGINRTDNDSSYVYYEVKEHNGDIEHYSEEWIHNSLKEAQGECDKKNIINELSK